MARDENGKLFDPPRKISYSNNSFVVVGLFVWPETLYSFWWGLFGPLVGLHYDIACIIWDLLQCGRNGGGRVLSEANITII